MVPGHPTALLACRYHGLNQPAPQGTLARTAKLPAAMTAKLLNSIPVPAGGPAPACPVDLNDETLLIFHYHHSPDLWVTVQASGCLFVSNGARSAFPAPRQLIEEFIRRLGQDRPDASIRSERPIPPGRAHFTASGLSFTYPNTWTSTRPSSQATIGTDFVYLANQQLSDPCHSTASAAGMTVSCGWPLTSLAEDSVVIDWSLYTGPAPPDQLFEEVNGLPTFLSGYRAKIDVPDPGAACPGLAATNALLVTLQPNSRGSYQAAVCMRNPTTHTLHTLGSVLASIRFSG